MNFDEIEREIQRKVKENEDAVIENRVSVVIDNMTKAELRHNLTLLASSADNNIHEKVKSFLINQLT